MERMLAVMDPTSDMNTTTHNTRRQRKKLGSLSESLEEKSREENTQDGLDFGMLRAEFEFNLRVNRGTTVDGSTTPSDGFFDTFDEEGGFLDDDEDVPGIVPLDDGGHVSVARLAREAKSAVLKHQRRAERRRLRREAEEAAGRGKTTPHVKRSPSTLSRKGTSQPR